MHCFMCERGCIIKPGETGLCGAYTNREGALREVAPDLYSLVMPISVETMPMLHFRAGGKYLQISTFGCNLSCPGCVSACIVEELPTDNGVSRHLVPDEVIAEAGGTGCEGIAFLMNEPITSLPTFVRVAERAKAAGLFVGCATNGLFTQQSLELILPYLDFVHVGFKGFSDEVYRACGASSVGPVLRNLRTLVASGVHVEVSCVHRSGQDGEVEQVAERVAEMSRDIPFHIMRFMPLEEAEPRLEPSAATSEALCAELRRSLLHVYLFNTPGSRYLDTVCPECGQTLIRRDFYGPMGARVRSTALLDEEDGDSAERVRCSSCAAAIPIRGGVVPDAFTKDSFDEGGYPFTRGVDIQKSILIALGVESPGDLHAAWRQLLLPRGFRAFPRLMTDPETFVDSLPAFGRAAGREEEARTLAACLREKMDVVRRGVEATNTRPRVYYCMGKPWYALCANRFENALVEWAGGESVNRKIRGEGRPGITVEASLLEQLDPEHVVISSMSSHPLETFLEDCRAYSINVSALRTSHVHTFPVPQSDFGGPRWILGLLHLANVIHPELFSFDVEEEARLLYKRFYRREYEREKVNRSFGRPLYTWSPSAS